MMKLLAMIPLLPMAAFAVTVEPLPPSEFADTEVSTNIAFAVERPAMTRIEFTVALDATPTNNVEVAIGTDANSDGNLAVEEAAYVFGWDCGKWFVRDQVKVRGEGRPEVKVIGEGEQRMLPSCSGWPAESVDQFHCSPSPSTFTYSSHTFILKMRKLDTAWDTVKVTRRGCGAAFELVKADGKLPGFKLEVR